MRILHAIHDFLPRHLAGSEIYAFELCRELSARHHVTVVCGGYDPSQAHGRVQWRVHDGLPVVEIVNNWVCASFEETYAPPLITARLAQVLRAVQPDVLHVHSLLNLSFDLPALARARGVPVVATLHDHTLVCPTGGQRVHHAEDHVCHAIDTARCARCFPDSPFHDQIAFARLTGGAHAPGPIRRAAAAAARRHPRLAAGARLAVKHAPVFRLESEQIEARLAAARRVFDQIDLFVAPSTSMASEFERLGIAPSKIRVSDYGFVPLRANRRSAPGRPLRIGYVGTLVWHKGAHVLVDAVRGIPPADYEVKIFGDTNVFPEYSAALRASAEGLPIHFMGRFSRERTAEVYAQIDVLVVPSIWIENSPLVIHEAFMAGVPVVGARIGGIPELVEDGRSGLLYEPASVAALEAALRGLVDQPARVTALAMGLPAVKPMADDARAWEAVYGELARAGSPVAQTT